MQARCGRKPLTEEVGNLSHKTVGTITLAEDDRKVSDDLFGILVTEDADAVYRICVVHGLLYFHLPYLYHLHIPLSRRQAEFWAEPQAVTLYVQGTVYIVRKQLSRTQALRYGRIECRTPLGNGV